MPGSGLLQMVKQLEPFNFPPKFIVYMEAWMTQMQQGWDLKTAHCFISTTKAKKAVQLKSFIHQVLSPSVDNVRPGISVAFLQAQEGLCDNNKQSGEQ